MSVHPLPSSGLVADVMSGPPVALYRLYDRAGTLLYVGVTSDPRTRWAQHKADKRWWRSAYRYRLEWHTSREDALLEEGRVITEERPAHNAQGAGGVKPLPRPVSLEPLPPDTLLSIREIMSRHGVSRQGLHVFRQRPDFPAPVPSAGNTRPRWRAGDIDAYFQANPKRQGARTDLQRV